MLQTFSINSWIINVSCILRFANYPIKYSGTLTLNKTTMGLVLLILCIQLLLCIPANPFKTLNCPRQDLLPIQVYQFSSKSLKNLTHSLQMQYKSKIYQQSLATKTVFQANTKLVAELSSTKHLFYFYCKTPCFSCVKYKFLFHLPKLKKHF